jgi:stromal membrane-associated protein
MLRITLTDKYEFKRFIRADISRGDIGRVDRSVIVAAHLGPSRSASSVKSSASFSSPLRSQTLPPTKPSLPPATSAPATSFRSPTLPPSADGGTTMTRSVSQPIQPQTQLQPPPPPATGVWSDLASLQGSAATSTLPLQYLSPTTSSTLLAPSSSSPFNINPVAGSSSMSANFTQGVSPSPGLASQGPSFGVSSSPVHSGSNFATPSFQTPYTSGTSPFNPFTQMAALQQSQAQLQQNHALSTSPFGSLASQQPSFSPQGQLPQIQQPVFSQPGTNPFFNATAQSQHMLSPQPQALTLSNTPSPIPFTGSPFQQPTQTPFQQQPSFQPGAQAPFQPQPPQFGNVQPSGAGVPAPGNPFTSWLTQQPNSYASAHVGQGSGQWGMM